MNKDKHIKKNKNIYIKKISDAIEKQTIKKHYRF